MAITACTTDDAIEQIENVSPQLPSLPCARVLCGLARGAPAAGCSRSMPGLPTERRRTAARWHPLQAAAPSGAAPTRPWSCPAPAPQVGHDFFLYRDSEDGEKLKVLYRRK